MKDHPLLTAYEKAARRALTASPARIGYEAAGAAYDEARAALNAALSPSLIQPQGEERSEDLGLAAADDNHKALVDGVLQVQSDLQMLARACRENDPKAEISIRISDVLGVIQDRIAPLLAEFQSRQEEK